MEDLNHTEYNLDKLMEMCLEEKQYDIMERTLERISPTYSKYKYYKNKLNESRNISDIFQ